MQKHIFHARAFVNNYSSMFSKILREVKGGPQNSLSRQSVTGNGPHDFNRVPPSRDVLLFPWIDATPDGDCSVMPATHDVQVASSSSFK